MSIVVLLLYIGETKLICLNLIYMCPLFCHVSLVIYSVYNGGTLNTPLMLKCYITIDNPNYC